LGTQLARHGWIELCSYVGSLTQLANNNPQTVKDDSVRL